LPPVGHRHRGRQLELPTIFSFTRGVCGFRQPESAIGELHANITSAEQSCRVGIVTFVYRSHCVHLNFLKPIWLACSLKHLLQIMSSYFLMRPSWFVQHRHARESLPYFLGWECCWWGIFLQVVCFLDLLFINNFQIIYIHCLSLSWGPSAHVQDIAHSILNLYPILINSSTRSKTN
jgi:hypothetical protein